MTMDGNLTQQVDELANRIRTLREHRELLDEPELLLDELDTAHEELRVADEEVRAQQEQVDLLLSHQEAARMSQDRLVALMPAAVVTTDQTGGVLRANPLAHALLEVGGQRLLGKPLLGFVEPSDRPELRQRLSEAVRTGAAELHTTVTMTPRHGKPVPMQMAATLGRESHRVGATVEVTWVLLPSGAPVPRPLSGDAEQHRQVARTLVAITELAVHRQDRFEVLTQVASLVEEAFTFPVSASISVGAPTHPELVATRSKLAQSVDGAQLIAGEGPCQTAWEDSEVVCTPDLRTDGRWPRLHRHVEDLPARSVVAVPVTIGEENTGALNLYAPDHRLADDNAVEAARLLAAAVAAVLHETNVKVELERVASQLETALTSRAVIDQAKGIVMARHHCSADQAFSILARVSSNSNTKLRDVAAKLVTEVSGEPPAPPPTVRR